MKITKLFAVVLTMVLFAGMSQAQSKTAYINYTELMSKLPEVDSIQSQLTVISETYQKTLTAIEKELNSKQKYWAEFPSEDPAINELRTQEYQGLVNRYQSIEKEATKVLQEKQEELLEPIVENVKKVIGEVAKSKGYQFVLDSSPGSSVIYSDPAHNLMDAVKAKMIVK
jgi:outer membrane protein